MNCLSVQANLNLNPVVIVCDAFNNITEFVHQARELVKYLLFYLQKYYGQNFGAQNCRKSDLLPKILSAEIFPLKSIKDIKLIQTHISIVNCMGK